MFQSTRLKLTAWYLVIIMAITVLFSIVIYRVISLEIDRSLHAQQFRQFRLQIEEGLISPFSQPNFDTDLLNQAENRLGIAIIAIDAIILVISGIAGYFLAGKTLRPIQKMVEEQNRFVTDASHELNTPLTSLRTSIEVNLRDKKLSLEKAKKLLESNLEEVNNLQILSEDLIKLTQYHKSNGQSIKELISVSEIISQATQKLSPLAEKKKIQLDVGRTEGQLYGDKKSLTELFVILLDNAIKYSPSETIVQINSQLNDGKVKITVLDQGAGIDKNDLPFIFDRFYRADKSRSKHHIGGYGLGLSIAKGIVDVHKGQIFVKSTIGKGTIFTILLPLN